MENNNFEKEESFEGGFKVNVDNIYSNSEDSADDVELEEFEKQPQKHQKEKKGLVAWWSNRKKWQKGVIISVSAIILVLAIVVGTVRTVFDYNYHEIQDAPENLGFEDVIDKNVINVALFGIDARDPKTFEGLSDSIMILSLDTVNKKVKIVSVMRDSFVPIPQNSGKTKHAKINSAYASGGPETAIKTLNTVFGLDISEYATVNFYGMADIIDAVGGIDAELTKAEVSKNAYHGLNECIDEICEHLGVDSDKYHIYKSGKQHLNGIQAVAYSRIRYVKNIWGTNNDYGRTDRQRFVMEQLFNKALSMKKSQYMKLAKALMPCCETSLTYTEIMDLAVDMLLASPTFSQYRVPQQEFIMKAPSGFGSVVYYDLNYAKKLMHAYFYEDIAPEDFIAENGIEKNGWYKGGQSSGTSNSKKEESTANSTTTTSTEESVSSQTSKPESSVSGPQTNEESENENDDVQVEETPDTNSEIIEAENNTEASDVPNNEGSDETEIDGADNQGTVIDESTDTVENS